jgi:hypothetical protein
VYLDVIGKVEALTQRFPPSSHTCNGVPVVVGSPVLMPLIQVSYHCSWISLDSPPA